MKKIIGLLIVSLILFCGMFVYAYCDDKLMAEPVIEISNASTEEKIIIKSDSSVSGLSLYVASYKGHVLKDVLKKDNISLVEGDNEIGIDVPWTTSQRNKVKVFLWDENLSPVAKHISLDIYPEIEGGIITFADAEDSEDFYGLYSSSAQELHTVPDPIEKGNNVYFLDSNVSDKTAFTYLKIDTVFEPGCEYSIEYDVMLGDDAHGDKVSNANIGTCFAYSKAGTNNISQILIGGAITMKAGAWKHVSQTYVVPEDFNTNVSGQFFGIFANPIKVDGYDYYVAVDFYVDNLRVVPLNGKPVEKPEAPSEGDDDVIEGAIINYADAENPNDFGGLYTSGAKELHTVEDPLIPDNNVYFIDANINDRASWSYIWIDTKFEPGCTYAIEYDVFLGDDVLGNKVASAAIGTCFEYAPNGSTQSKQNGIGNTVVTAGAWQRVCQEYTVPADYNTNVKCRFGVFGNPVDVAGYSHKIAIDFYLDNILVAPIDNIPTRDDDIGKAEDVYFVGSTVKNPLEYKSGETMTFKLGIKNKTISGMVTAPFIQYTCTGDDGVQTTGYVSPSEDGYYYFDTKCEKDGFVRVVAKICDENKRALSEYTPFEGGAGAYIDKIRCDTPEPEDYLEFWDDLKKTAFSLENEVIYEKEIAAQSGFVAKDMRLKTAEGAGDYTSFVITYPKDAQPGTLKLRMIFMGYGVGKANASYKAGYITVSMNSHDIPNDLTQAEYDNLKNNKYKSYGWIESENQEPETSYWWKMFVRNMQGYNYATHLDLFDGINVEYIGSSQGGFQSCNMAAHTPLATHCSMDVPWFGNLYGNKVSSRQQGWYPAPLNGLCYFDTAIAAKHIKCKTDISAGLGDYTCPPSAIMAIYNNLNCEKTLKFIQNKTHSYTPPSYSQYTISDN